jgi:hypothetical protein
MSRALSHALALVVALALVARGVAGEPAVVGTPRTDGYVGFVCPPGYQNFTLWTGVKKERPLLYTCNPGSHWTGDYLGTEPEIKNAYVVGEFAEKGWQIKTPLIKVIDYTGMTKPPSKPEGDAVKMTRNETLDERNNTNWNACVPGLKDGMMFGFTLEVDTNCYPDAERKRLCKPKASCEGHGTYENGNKKCVSEKNLKKFRSEAAMKAEAMEDYDANDDAFDTESLVMDKDISPIDGEECAKTTKDGSHVAREYQSANQVRSIQKFFTHCPVSTFDRVPFQLTGELFLYGTALRRCGTKKGTSRRSCTRTCGGRAGIPARARICSRFRLTSTNAYRRRTRRIHPRSKRWTKSRVCQRSGPRPRTTRAAPTAPSSRFASPPSARRRRSSRRSGACSHARRRASPQNRFHCCKAP